MSASYFFVFPVWETRCFTGSTSRSAGNPPSSVHIHSPPLQACGVVLPFPLGSNRFPNPTSNTKVAAKVLLDPLQLIRVKIARVECLAQAGFPAEAASALAAVLQGGGTATTTGNYAGRRCAARVIDTAASLIELPVWRHEVFHLDVLALWRSIFIYAQNDGRCIARAVI